MKKHMRYIVLIIASLLLTLPQVAIAADAVLTWNANIETDLAGYKFYRANQGCTAQGPLAPLLKGTPPIQVQVGKVTTYTDGSLPPLDGTYCWEITAFDTFGNESGRSNRASKDVNMVPPTAPTGLNAVLQ